VPAAAEAAGGDEAEEEKEWAGVLGRHHPEGVEGSVDRWVDTWTHRTSHQPTPSTSIQNQAAASSA
jgi:hypothetical protein